MIEGKKISKREISQNIHNHLSEIMKEFTVGFEELRKYPKSVSIFGSSHSTPASPHYKIAEELAGRIVRETGYTVMTGGGPGIMAAANLGAKEANGQSVGFTIDLHGNQHTNPYITATVNFDYFFVRKAILTFCAEAYVFFPGGFGTFDELFDILTQIQTKKIPKIPVILMGKDYWNSFNTFMITHMLEQHHAITEEDLGLFIITDNLDHVIEIIKAAPISEWWNNKA